MKDIELIDLLLRHSKENAVVVKKVEVNVSVNCFKDKHIPKELFQALADDNMEFYMMDDLLFVKRTFK